MKVSAAEAAISSVKKPSKAQKIELIFGALFGLRFNVELVGGADEPLYQPARNEAERNRIFYRLDYAASALHELSHWCIAGTERRELLDYGYWYAPDGRSEQQQLEFEQVEVKPQALEWLLATACAMPFRLSADNLEQGSGPSEIFRERVFKRARELCDGAISGRAKELVCAFASAYETRPLDKTNYQLAKLR